MGFKREVPTLALTFIGELAGLEVEVREVGLEQHDKIRGLSNRIAGLVGSDGQVPTQDVMEAFRELSRDLPTVLVSWNVEDDNGPVPCDREGLERQGMSLQSAIAFAWVAALAEYANGVASSTVEVDKVSAN